MSLSGVMIARGASKDECKDSRRGLMNVNARLVRNVKTDHVATSERKLSLETGRATTTSTYIVESVKDGALTANIAKMRLEGQSCIRSLISSRLRTSLVGSLSRFKRLELGLAGSAQQGPRACPHSLAILSRVMSCSSSLSFIKVGECITSACNVTRW